MPEHEPIPIPLESDHGPPVVGNVFCTRCDYDLRGLPERGRCPECSLPIISSLPGSDRMLGSDWVRLRRGLWLVFAANVLILAACLAAFESLNSFSALREWCLIAFPVAISALTVVRAWGHILIASIPARIARPTRAWQAHQLLRYSALSRAAASTVSAIVIVLTNLQLLVGRDEVVVGVVLLAGFAYLNLGLIQYFALIQVLESIASRSRSRRLAGAVSWHNTTCLIGAVPGTLVFGLGLPVMWLSYHTLVVRFILAANKAIAATHRCEPFAE